MRSAFLLRLFISCMAVLSSSVSVPAFAQGKPPSSAYHPSGMCDDYPRLDLKVPKGLCVGLVAENLGFPRGVAAIDQDIYVVDMGGWDLKRGRLLRLSLKKPSVPEVLLSHLDMPNAIVATPDGQLLISVLGRIVRLDPKARNPVSTMEDVVINLPGSGRHPLSAMALGADGALYINVGSATDHCERKPGLSGPPELPCPETTQRPPRGSVLRAVLPTESGVVLDARKLQVYARGLRNSLALALSPAGTLIAATNSRDAINQADAKLSDVTLPHDTLSWLKAGADYGWPYCFDKFRPSPEYAGFDCGKKTASTRLLPAHAAPFGMLVYRGETLPALAGHLIIGYHGFRAAGHKLVSLALDNAYRPQGMPVDLISDWNAIPGKHPMGAPVALAMMADGSILITEDRNGTLLRLAAE